LGTVLRQAVTLCELEVEIGARMFACLKQEGESCSQRALVQWVCARQADTARIRQVWNFSRVEKQLFSRVVALPASKCKLWELWGFSLLESGFGAV
jgi:hypothetical protein